MASESQPNPEATLAARALAGAGRIDASRIGGGATPPDEILLAGALGNINDRIDAAQQVPGRAGVEEFHRDRLQREADAAQAPIDEPTPRGPSRFRQGLASARETVGGLFRRRESETELEVGADGVEAELSKATGRPLTDRERVSLREIVRRTLSTISPRFIGGAAIGDYLRTRAEAVRNTPGAIIEAVKSKTPYELLKEAGEMSAKAIAIGVVSAGLRTGARLGISQLAMFGSAGTTVLAATAASGALSLGREIYKQFKTERTGSRSAEWAKARDKHRNLITASWSYADKSRIAKQVAKGMASGFVGSTIGVGYAELGVLDAAGRFVFDKLGAISIPTPNINIGNPLPGTGEALSGVASSVSDATKSPRDAIAEQWKNAQALDKDMKQAITDRPSEITKPITDAVRGAGSTVSDVTAGPREFVANITAGPRGFVADKFEGAKGFVGLADAPADTSAQPAVAQYPSSQDLENPTNTPIPSTQYPSSQNLENPAPTPDQSVALQSEQEKLDAYVQATEANTKAIMADNAKLEEQNATLRQQLAEAQAKTTATPVTATSPSTSDAPATGVPAVPGAGATAAAGAAAEGAATTGVSDLKIPEGLLPKNGVVELPQGSNPWNEVARVGNALAKENLGRSLTNEEMVILTKELLKQSAGFEGQQAVGGVWGLPSGEGIYDHRAIPPGYKLNFGGILKSVNDLKK